MALVPHKITALAESDADGTDGKNIVAGAVVSLFDTEGNAVTLFDDESGANGSTAKQTDSEGVVVVYVTPGEYDEQVNGGIQRRVLIGNKEITTEQLIERIRKTRVGDVITTTGFYDAGDAGGAQWKATATTGLTPSQTPADREARELVDGSGRLWRLIGDEISVESLGASPSLPDNAGIFKAASNGGNVKIRVGNGIFLSSNFSLDDNTTIEGALSTTIKSIDNNNASWLLLNANGKDNIKILGVTFDGNTSGNTSFNSINLIFNSTRVRFEHCNFVNCRGIATFASGGEDVGMFKCNFEDCGVYHLTSGNNSDRKQAFACSGVLRPYAKECTFKNIGLDCISFATNCKDAIASGNTIDTNYAGSIYISNVDKFKVFGNTVNNKAGGGNGIDCVNSRNGEVFGNHCFENGAAGILFADCVNVECFGNVCWNNYQSANSVHRGGITLSALSACENINIHGNTCFDDQGPGSVTQRFSIGVYTTGGGTYSRIRVDENNDLKGYNSSGNESLNDVFQTNAMGFCGYPIQLNVADQATVNLFDTSEVISSFSIIQVNNNLYGQFYNRQGQSASKAIDAASSYSLTDTGTTQAVFSEDGYLKLRNRTGSTKAYLIQPLSYAVI